MDRWILVESQAANIQFYAYTDVKLENILYSLQCDRYTNIGTLYIVHNFHYL